MQGTRVLGSYCPVSARGASKQGRPHGLAMPGPCRNHQCCVGIRGVADLVMSTLAPVACGGGVGEGGSTHIAGP